MNAHTYSSVSAFNTLADIACKNITVMGLGLNGGGLATARFLLEKGASVTVTDLKNGEDLLPSVAELEKAARDLGVQSQLRLVLGKHEYADFANADVVIKNPGVKFEGNQFLAAAKSIETDLSLFLRFTKAPIIAVTGSKGKSSTASAIHYGLEQAGFTAFLGGNITVSPLTFLDQTTCDTPVVLELSSWQLADLRGRGVLKPKIAVITKIVPDHQNWYGTMEKYVADKKLVYASQDEGDFTLCSSDEWGAVFAAETHATVLRYAAVSGFHPASDFCGAWLDEKNCGWMRLHSDSQPFFILGTELAVHGFHMRENLLNAALVLAVMGVASSRTAAILAKYSGIHHRLEYFHTWTSDETDATAQKAQVLFYNDSAATVPEATAAAVRAFEQPIHLICGGTDKNLLFEPLAREISRAKSIYLLIGTGTDKLLPMLEERMIVFCGPFSSLETLLQRLKADICSQNDCKKAENAVKEIVVFSPGATSFGMFKNEFDRGVSFKGLVKKLF